MDAAEYYGGGKGGDEQQVVHRLTLPVIRARNVQSFVHELPVLQVDNSHAGALNDARVLQRE